MEDVYTLSIKSNNTLQYLTVYDADDIFSPKCEYKIFEINTPLNVEWFPENNPHFNLIPKYRQVRHLIKIKPCFLALLKLPMRRGANVVWLP